MRVTLICSLTALRLPMWLAPWFRRAAGFDVPICHGEYHSILLREGKKNLMGSE